jgi:DNA invertase Pin-like site-specific DNA recombinase
MTATRTPLAEISAGLKKPGRRLGYARVSTNDQDPGSQERRLLAAGFEGVWTDKGASGTRAHRPRWDALRDELQPGDTLGCVKLDRIGRSVANLLEVTGWLKANEISLVVLDQSIDTSTPTGRLMFTMLAAIAEFERDLIVERTLDGQMEVRAMGNLRRSLGGPAPFGLRDPGPADDDARDWETDDDAAAMLNRVADAILPPHPQSLSSAWAAERETYVAEHGTAPTDANGREVNEKMVRAALRRSATAGMITKNDAEPALADPPMDLAKWRKLSALFDSRRSPGRVTTDDDPYWAGPLLRCEICGNQMSGAARRPRSRAGTIPGATPVAEYRCANAHKSLGVLKPCKRIAIPAEPVNEAIALAVQTYAPESKHLALAARRQAGVATERARLGDELAGWQQAMEDLLPTQRYTSRVTFIAARDEIAREIDRLGSEIDALDSDEGASSFAPVVDWENMPGTERRKMASEVITTPIAVASGKGKIPVGERIDLQPYREGEAAA